MSGIKDPVKVRVNFQLIVICPHCSDEFDLIAHDDNDEGFWNDIFRKWFNNEKDADKIKEDVLCPTCENRIDLNLLEY